MSEEAPQKLYGNNRVFCEGRFISGPDARSCIATLVLVCLPSLLWHIEVGSFLATRYTWFLPFMAVLMQLSTVKLLVCTAFSDPGIVPRQKDFIEVYDPRTQTYRSKMPPRYFDVILRGVPFKVKYCTTCNIYRPPRCTHCAVCENCIERFDHHCPWIGNCIGKRNYWLFYSFVTSIAILTSFVLATAIVEMAVLCQKYQDDRGMPTGDALVRALGDAPLCAVVIVYCGAICWFPLGLWMYHNYLICTNQTTYEQIKGVYSRSPNPFNRGPLGNCKDVLCSQIRPRFFNASTMEMLWPKSSPEEVRTGPKEEVTELKFDSVTVELANGSGQGAAGGAVSGAAEGAGYVGKNSGPAFAAHTETPRSTRSSNRSSAASGGAVTPRDKVSFDGEQRISCPDDSAYELCPPQWSRRGCSKALH